MPVFDNLPEPTRDLVLAALNATNTSQPTVDIKLSNLFNLSPAGPYVLSKDVLVADAIDASYGKYPSSLVNVIVMEQSFAQSIVNNPFAGVNPLLSGVIINDIDLNDYAMTVVVNMNDRSSIYTETSEKRHQTMIRKTNQVMKRLGINFDAEIQVPISSTLNATQFLRIFVDELFFTVIFVLGILSLILVTSLLLSDTEEKTFEFGILRSLGLKNNHLVILLCLQAMIFAVPGILLGLLMCFVVYIPIGYIISNYVYLPVDFSISGGSIILGVLLGLLLPILGVMVPIKRALGKIIRDALDVYHNTTFETVLKIQNLEKMGISTIATIVSLLLVVIGFMVYYLIPLSFALNRLDIFFRIFTCILLGIFIGLVFIFDALQAVLGQFFATILTYIGDDYKVSQIVLKNLAGHMSRNRKTSLMFTLCVGYIVLASAMFDLQINSFSENLSAVFGADVYISTPSFNLPLPERALRSFVSRKSDLIDDCTFITFSLDAYYPVKWMQVQRLAGFNHANTKLYGVESNFLNVILPKYYVIDNLNPNLGYNYSGNLADAISALYDYFTPYSIPFQYEILSNLVLPSSSNDSNILSILGTPNIT